MCFCLVAEDDKHFLLERHSWPEECTVLRERLLSQENVFQAARHCDTFDAGNCVEQLRPGECRVRQKLTQKYSFLLAVLHTTLRNACTRCCLRLQGTLYAGW